MDRLLFERGFLRVHVGDAVALGVALLLAFLSYSGRHTGADLFPFLRSDAGDIAGYAAALDHPDAFHGDAALSDPAHFGHYVALQLPLVRWLTRFTGDYGLSTLLLLPPCVFLHVVGFYVFGVTLLARRFWALLASLVLLGYVPVNYGTFWGAFPDVLPRFMFQALMGFPLAIAVHGRRDPRTPRVTLFLCGLLMYVHGVSAPALAFALWLGAWPALRSHGSWRRQLALQVGNGCVFLATSLPFLVLYGGGHAHGSVESYSTVMDAIVAVNGTHTFAPIRGMFKFFGSAALPLALGALGVGLLAYRGRLRDDRLRLLGLWSLGVLCVAVLLPSVEIEVSRALEQIPFQIDLVRTIRLLVPFALVAFVWGGMEYALALRHARAAQGAALLAALAWLAWAEPIPTAAEGVRNLAWHGTLHREAPRQRAVRGLLVAAREATPPGATFLSNDDFLSAALRYSALRPIVFTPFDRGMFAYTDFPALLTWMEQSRRVEEAARRIGSGRGDLVAEYLDLARAFGAEHVALVAERPEDLRVPVELRSGVLFHDAEQGLLLARVPERDLD